MYATVTVALRPHSREGLLAWHGGCCCSTHTGGRRAWQIYKSVTLLDYLIKNGTRRLVDDARDNIYVTPLETQTPMRTDTDTRVRACTRARLRQRRFASSDTC